MHCLQEGIKQCVTSIDVIRLQRHGMPMPSHNTAMSGSGTTTDHTEINVAISAVMLTRTGPTRTRTRSERTEPQGQGLDLQGQGLKISP